MTVAELIIAVAVVGILALVAVPVFSGVRHASLENAALNNVRLINAARDSFALTNPDAATDWTAASTDEERLRLLIGANLLAGVPSDYSAMPGGYSVQLTGPVRSRTVLLSGGVAVDY
jgi:type II secretory pathway pseudopilin PulG